VLSVLICTGFPVEFSDQCSEVPSSGLERLVTPEYDSFLTHVLHNSDDSLSEVRALLMMIGSGGTFSECYSNSDGLFYYATPLLPQIASEQCLS
jgi:hypothetical protein